MTRIRKALLAAAVALALMLSLAPVASADPGDPGGTTFSSEWSTYRGPGRPTSSELSTYRGQGRPTISTGATLDPGDPGGTP